MRGFFATFLSVRRHLAARIFVTFFVALYTVMVVFALLFYWNGHRNQEEALRTQARQQLDKAQQRLSDTLREIDEIGSFLLSDSSVSMMVRNKNQVPTAAWFADYNVALRLMRNYMVGRGGIVAGVGLFTEDGRTCMVGTINTLPAFDAPIREGLHALPEYPFVLRGLSPADGPRAVLLLQLSRDFWDNVLVDGLEQGYAIGVFDGQLQPMFLRVEPGVYAQQLTEQLTVAAREGGRATWDMLLLRGEAQSGLVLSLGVPKEVMRHSLRQLTWQVVWLLLILLLTTALLSGLVAGSVTRRIRILQRNAERIGAGDYAQITALDARDELGELGASMAQMAQRIEALIADVNQREELKRELEVQILRAQISPHFLYNALNTITRLASLQGAENIRQFTASLITLLQSALNTGDTLIPLDEEIAYAHSYFSMMRYRFVHPLRMEIEIDEAVQQAQVMRMVLQPIVENALIHGIGVNAADGQVRLRAWREGDSLLLSVTDNGAGMSPEQIAAALSAPQNKDPLRFSGIGIRNVVDRLNLRFGEQSGIDIQSRPQRYTAVTLRMPLIFYSETTPTEGSDHGQDHTCG